MSIFFGGGSMIATSSNPSLFVAIFHDLFLGSAVTLQSSSTDLAALINTAPPTTQNLHAVFRIMQLAMTSQQSWSLVTQQFHQIATCGYET